jgi:hypothetical protein
MKDIAGARPNHFLFHSIVACSSMLLAGSALTACFGQVAEAPVVVRENEAPDATALNPPVEESFETGPIREPRDAGALVQDARVDASGPADAGKVMLTCAGWPSTKGGWLCEALTDAGELSPERCCRSRPWAGNPDPGDCCLFDRSTYGKDAGAEAGP